MPHHTHREKRREEKRENLSSQRQWNGHSRYLYFLKRVFGCDALVSLIVGLKEAPLLLAIFFLLLSLGRSSRVVAHSICRSCELLCCVGSATYWSTFGRSEKKNKRHLGEIEWKKDIKQCIESKM